MWKLCEHTTSFIGNVFAIISNTILCHVVFSFHNLISCCVYSFSFSFLVVYVQNSKKWLIHNYNIKQHNSVLKVVWEYVTKAQSLYNSVEMLFLIWMWWLCSGVQRLPTTTESTKSIRRPFLHATSILASIVVVAIDCELLECEWVVLLFVCFWMVNLCLPHSH